MATNSSLFGGINVKCERFVCGDNILREVSKLGHTHPPAVALRVVLLDLFQIVHEMSEPRLLLLETGVALTMH